MLFNGRNKASRFHIQMERRKFKYYIDGCLFFSYAFRRSNKYLCTQIFTQLSHVSRDNKFLTLPLQDIFSKLFWFWSDNAFSDIFLCNNNLPSFHGSEYSDRMRDLGLYERPANTFNLRLKEKLVNS